MKLYLLSIYSVPGNLHLLPRLILVTTVKGRCLALLCEEIKRNLENEIHAIPLRSHEAKRPICVCLMPKPSSSYFTRVKDAQKSCREGLQNCFPQESNKNQIWTGRSHQNYTGEGTSLLEHIGLELSSQAWVSHVGQFRLSSRNDGEKGSFILWSFSAFWGDFASFSWPRQQRLQTSNTVNFFSLLLQRK